MPTSTTTSPCPTTCANDRAVLAAYGFPATIAEPDCVAKLFKLYQTLAANN